MLATKSRPPRAEPRHLQVTKALEKVPEPATPSAKEAERPDRSRLLMWAALALLAVVVGGVVYAVLRGQSAEESEAALLRLIDTECGPGGTDPGAPLCVLTAPQRADSTAAAATAAGVDAAQVVQLVNARLAELGVGGPLPDVAAIVRETLDQNRDLYRGEPGKPGDPAPPPTDAQVQAAVAVVFASIDPELFRGETGRQGVQGIGVNSLTFEERGGLCVAVIQLVDPADGSTREQTAPVSDQVCASTAPPPDPDPTPTDPDPDPVPDAPAPDAPAPSTAPEPGGLFG